MLLRTATAADADDIARVHVRSWQAAYHGLMPAEVLDALSVSERAANWARILTETARDTLVVEQDGRVIGWASFGEARDADAPGSGELWGIYVDPGAWSTGAGHLLLTSVEDALRAAGHVSAYLWVLDGNERAAAFYERHGWASDGGVKVEHRPRLVLHERRHGKRLA